MWIIFNLRKEFKKIYNSFNEVRKEIIGKANKEDVVSKKEIDLMIREAILKVQFIPNPEQNSELNKETHFNKIVMLNANKKRPALIKQSIRGLLEKGLRTTEIFNIVVNEKKIVGKTQFYHYLTLIKSELRTPIRTELRTKKNK